MCAQSKSAEMLARENCASIVLLRQQAGAVHTAASGAGCSGIYKCKFCDRAFDSFQALGGHRASHKKIRLTGDAVVAPAASLKVHQCGQCWIRFPTGQALGGHMRKHADSNVKRKRVEEDGSDDDENVLEDRENRIQIFPILRESKMGKRVVLQLDLNFPPPMEDDRSFLQLACVG